MPRLLKVHWHEISEVIDFQFFAIYWIYLVKRPAWDTKIFDWANRVWARFVMRILSMRRTPSILYWVYAGYVLFYTEYTQKTSYFILSINWEKICPINIHPPELYWVYAGCLHFHTEYTQKTIFFIWKQKTIWTILSINWGEIMLLVRQTTSHTSHLTFIGKSSQGG